MNAHPAYLPARSAYANWLAPEIELDFGRGAWLYARDGRRYLDFASGSGSLIFGHGDAGAAATVATQASRYAVYPGTEFRDSAVERYLERLTAFAGGMFSRAMLASSGSDAVEAACKLALQYHHARGNGERVHVIGRQASYHGNTLFGLGVGGFVRRRAPYERVLSHAAKAASALCYRCSFGLAPQACTLECATSVEDAFRIVGPETVAAYVMEPVVGAALSAGVPDPRYTARVREICDRHGVLLIVDEVLTGFGRTGQALAWHHWNVQPDIAIVGKAMSAGYFPLSGIIVTEPVAATLHAADQYFENGQTHLFSPTGAAIGDYVLERLECDALIDQARRLGEIFQQRLTPMRAVEIVGDVRGLGLMIGIELVRDRATRAPFLVQDAISRRFAKLAREAGVIVYPSTGGPDSIAGDHVLLLPPLILDEADLEFAAEALLRAATGLSERVAGAPRGRAEAAAPI